jgi:starch synthase
LELHYLKILFISAEVAPFAKVGGLADVAGSLPKALRALGHDVRVLMPSYLMVEEELEAKTVAGDPDVSRRAAENRRGAGLEAERSFTRRVDSFDVAINPSWVKQAYLNETTLEGGLAGGSSDVPVYMVGTDEWFTKTVSSETIYLPGVDAYLFFAAAAVQIPDVLGWMPDVIHCNDWHTGFIPVLMRERMRGTSGCVSSVFTIHNLAYQGEFGFDVLDKLALPHYLFNMDQLEFFGSVNFLKAGCVFADQVNTVSPSYGQEIQGPEYGCHLEGLMMHLARQKRLTGILNGIDDRVFDPALDPHIAAHYNADNLEGKAECRAALLARIGMEPLGGAPLLGAVTRLSDQKGMNLLMSASEKIFEMPCQMVVQGLGDPWLADSFAALEKKFPKHFRYVNAFDVALAQQVYAGCDGFLMPSLFEPCGLGQMIAMRYGTLPIVRVTGGLGDTVHEGTNGFTFTAKTSDALLDAVRRAHAAFGVTEEWSGLQQSAMRGDYSWAKSAREYVALYERAVAAQVAIAKSA